MRGLPPASPPPRAALTPEDLKELNCRICLGNTYHLGQRPGAERLARLGGLHEFMGWSGNLLTDSGGFQMVSLLELAEITEDGVRFKSPHDGRMMMLTPEESMQIQHAIGADIMMALDDVVSSVVTGPRVEEACHRTTRWLDRCIKAHTRTDKQNLFGIVQGGLDARLRDISLEALIARDLPGYAIGGLSGGEEKDSFWPVVLQCCKRLPRDKPRYLMGVGFPVDLVVCVALGVDMFDCVYPTRTARFGTALVDTGLLSLMSKEFLTDMRPVDPECPCRVCKTYTRSYLAMGFRNKDQAAAQHLSFHNISYQLRLMRRARQAILEDKLGDFVRDFFAKQFPDAKYPQWAVDALAAVNISL